MAGDAETKKEAAGGNAAEAEGAEIHETTEGAAPPKNPATFGQKVKLTIYLFVLVALLLPAICMLIDTLNVSASAEVSVAWEAPAGVALKAGPATFRYDQAKKRLVHYGVITAERKLELRALFEPTSARPQGAPAPAGAPPATRPTEPAPSAPASPEKKPDAATPGVVDAATTDSATAALARMEAFRRAYNEAIDNLAYLANVGQRDVINDVLILGMLGGILGAVLRSLVDFVGHACYTGVLDLHKWWPLYATRPIVGGILGFVLVVLFKAQLLGATDPPDDGDSFWWLGVAILGGFSTVDVTLRLRLAAKALFGSSQ